MKTFPIKLSDELHKEIRSKAYKAEKSMHAYILDCIAHPLIKINDSGSVEEFELRFGKYCQKCKRFGDCRCNPKEAPKCEHEHWTPNTQKNHTCKFCDDCGIYFDCEKCYGCNPHVIGLQPKKKTKPKKRLQVKKDVNSFTPYSKSKSLNKKK